MEMLILTRHTCRPQKIKVRCGQWHAWALPQDGAWEPVASREVCCFVFVPPEQAWGPVPNRSSSATVEGITDWTRFHVAKVNIHWAWIFVFNPPSQTETRTLCWLTLCQTSFLHFSMILMTFIVSRVVPLLVICVNWKEYNYMKSGLS